jgi:predicted metalloprotease
VFPQRLTPSDPHEVAPTADRAHAQASTDRPGGPSLALPATVIAPAAANSHGPSLDFTDLTDPIVPPQEGAQPSNAQTSAATASWAPSSAAEPVTRRSSVSLRRSAALPRRSYGGPARAYPSRAYPKQPRFHLRLIAFFAALFIVAALATVGGKVFLGRDAGDIPPVEETPTPVITIESQQPAPVYIPGPPDPSPDHPPAPVTEPAIEEALSANPLYLEEMAATTCAVGSIDLVNADHEAIQAHMNVFLDCLMAAWYPVVVQAGHTMPRPSVIVYDTSLETPCGLVSRVTAFYCPNDQQIYYDRASATTFDLELQGARYVSEAVVAHEFSHAVQYRTGILTAEQTRQSTSLSTEQADAWSRRLELQANCFSGLFFRSISASSPMTETDVAAVIGVFRQVGDEFTNRADHGSADSQEHWTRLGLAATSPGACNAFTAPDDAVR